MDCPNCGAAIARGSAKFCEFCGTELVRPGEPRPPTADEMAEEGFRRLKEHPNLPALRRHRPKSSGFVHGYIAASVVGVFFTIISLVIFTGFKSFEPPISLFPLLFTFVGIGLVIFGVSRAIRFANAPVERELVRVAGERVSVSGGGENSSASTTYYVTLEYEDGQRAEYHATGRTAGQVSEGDFGMAYLKESVLVDFRRVRV